jgi:hypothetical protein
MRAELLSQAACSADCMGGSAEAVPKNKMLYNQYLDGDYLAQEAGRKHRSGRPTRQKIPVAGPLASIR